MIATFTYARQLLVSGDNACVSFSTLGSMIQEPAAELANQVDLHCFSFEIGSSADQKKIVLASKDLSGDLASPLNLTQELVDKCVFVSKALFQSQIWKGYQCGLYDGEMTRVTYGTDLAQAAYLFNQLRNQALKERGNENPPPGFVMTLRA